MATWQGALVHVHDTNRLLELAERYGVAASDPSGPWVLIEVEPQLGSGSRCLIHAQEPQTPPPDRAKPRFRLRNDNPPRHRLMQSWSSTRKPAALREPSPTVEVHGRRKRVDSPSERRRCVLSKIREHVDGRAAHLAWRRERTTMPAVRPKTTAACDESIHGARNANGHALYAAGQSSRVARFDNEVHVIPLHGKVDDSKTLWLPPNGGTQGDTHARKNMLIA